MTEITRGQFVLAAAVVVVLVWLGAHTTGPLGGARAGAPDTTGTPIVARSAAGASTVRGEPGTAPAGPVAVQRAPRAQLVVHVAGAVRRPGVYRLRDGQRVADAIQRAGGGSRRADLDAINLATKVRDGVQILVPRRGASGGSRPGAAAVGPAGAGAGSAAGATGSAAVVDLNTATAEQLETLDGVGPATSAKILQYRAAHGPFRTVDDLEQIPGIGPKKLAAMRPRVRV